MIGMLVFVFEGTEPFAQLQNLGFGLLVLNGALALSLNTAGMFLIEAAGSSRLALFGMLKVSL